LPNFKVNFFFSGGGSSFAEEPTSAAFEDGGGGRMAPFDGLAVPGALGLNLMGFADDADDAFD
jgi:hypothetical protein